MREGRQFHEQFLKINAPLYFRYQKFVIDMYGMLYIYVCRL